MKSFFTINVLWLFLMVPWVGLQSMNVAFPGHIHLDFGSWYVWHSLAIIKGSDEHALPHNFENAFDARQRKLWKMKAYQSSYILPTNDIFFADNLAKYQSLKSL